MLEVGVEPTRAKTPTRPSTLRVYQFHHPSMGTKRGSGRYLCQGGGASGKMGKIGVRIGLPGFRQNGWSYIQKDGYFPNHHRFVCFAAVRWRIARWSRSLSFIITLRIGAGSRRDNLRNFPNLQRGMLECLERNQILHDRVNRMLITVLLSIV